MASYGAHHYKPLGRWVTCSSGDVPPNAVAGGNDHGETIFVGRAVQDGDVIPGKVVSSHSCCYVSYGGEERRHSEYQALVSDGAEFVWLPSSDGAVPCGAIQGGTCESGERLYIGRTFHNNTITIGKVHPSHRCLYIPYGGKEHSYDEYEVLVCKTVDF